MAPQRDASPPPIVWRLHLRSPPETVFRALATAEGRRSFWAESAEEEHGRIHFEFINGVEEWSPIIAREAPSRFEIRYFDSVVRFDIVSDGLGGTDLTMTNSQYEPDERAMLMAGWLNVLLPMKASVDHGIDLHNHDPDRCWDQNYADH